MIQGTPAPPTNTPPPPTNGFIRPTPTPAFSPPSLRPGEGSSQQLITPLPEGLLSLAFSGLGMGAFEGGAYEGLLCPQVLVAQGPLGPQ